MWSWNQRGKFLLIGPQKGRFDYKHFFYDCPFIDGQHSFLRNRQVLFFSAVKRSKAWWFWRETQAREVNWPRREARDWTVESTENCNLVSDLEL